MPNGKGTNHHHHHTQTRNKRTPCNACARAYAAAAKAAEKEQIAQEAKNAAEAARLNAEAAKEKAKAAAAEAYERHGAPTANALKAAAAAAAAAEAEKLRLQKEKEAKQALEQIKITRNAFLQFLLDALRYIFGTKEAEEQFKRIQSESAESHDIIAQVSYLSKIRELVEKDKAEKEEILNRTLSNYRAIVKAKLSSEESKKEIDFLNANLEKEILSIGISEFTNLINSQIKRYEKFPDFSTLVHEKNEKFKRVLELYSKKASKETARNLSETISIENKDSEKKKSSLLAFIATLNDEIERLEEEEDYEEVEKRKKEELDALNREAKKRREELIQERITLITAKREQQKRENNAIYGSINANTNETGKILVFDLDETIVGNSRQLLNETLPPYMQEKREGKNPNPPGVFLNPFVVQFLVPIYKEKADAIREGRPCKVAAIILLTNNSSNDFIQFTTLILAYKLITEIKQKYGQAIYDTIYDAKAEAGKKYKIKLFDYIIDREHRFRKDYPWEGDKHFKYLIEVESALKLLKKPTTNLSERTLFFDDKDYHALTSEIPKGNYFQIRPEYKAKKVVERSGRWVVDEEEGEYKIINEDGKNETGHFNVKKALRLVFPKEKQASPKEASPKEASPKEASPNKTPNKTPNNGK